jgi:hypothetical protein
LPEPQGQDLYSWSQSREIRHPRNKGDDDLSFKKIKRDGTQEPGTRVTRVNGRGREKYPGRIEELICHRLRKKKTGVAFKRQK